MVVVATYDMYKECCEGLLDSTWKIDEKEMISCSEFCMKLSKQMLEYNPRNNQYNGDNKLRAFIQNHKTRRTIKDAMDTCEQLDESFPEGGLTINNFKKGMMFPRLQMDVADYMIKNTANKYITWKY